MLIMSHRGFWQSFEEKNKLSAFERSFNFGFGIETDIRDCNGSLIVSHDMAVADSVKVNELFELYNKYNCFLPLALNIKSDGLQVKLKNLLELYNIQNYFVFDMSAPETLQYSKQEIIFFTRMSEYEKNPFFYEKANGVWLDEFENHWISEEIVKKHIENGKKVCIVSPELHGRKYIDEWKHYREIEKEVESDKIMICTDNPFEAQEFFNG